MKKTFFLFVAMPLFGLTTQAFGQAPENVVIEIRTIGIPPYGIQNDTNPGGIYFDLANRLAYVISETATLREVIFVVQMMRNHAVLLSCFLIGSFNLILCFVIDA